MLCYRSDVAEPAKTARQGVGRASAGFRLGAFIWECVPPSFGVFRLAGGRPTVAQTNIPTFCPKKMALDPKGVGFAADEADEGGVSFSSSSSLSSDDGEGGTVVNSRSTPCSKRTYGLAAQDISTMVKKRRRRLLHENLSVLRSITHSRATRRSCIISDAFKYIQELKQRVWELNRDLAAEIDARQRELVLGSPEQETRDANPAPVLPTVTVAGNGSGLEIHVSCEKWPGLLVAILEAVETLGLNVLQARVSCKDYFLFEAISGKDKQGKVADPIAVKSALLQVINRVNPEVASPASSEIVE